ncbi:hypothetical protein D1872_50660 [compost metagenome]
MSFKVLNHTLAGKLAYISTEEVQFGADGIGEIQSERVYQEVLEIANFFPVTEGIEPVPEPEGEEVDDGKSEEGSEPDTEEVKEEIKKSAPAKKTAVKK